jgi:hypothetical protein
VDESEAVLRRLERIEQLDRSGAPAADLLEELRALVAEADSWSKGEGGDVGERAVDDLRRALSVQARNVRAQAPSAQDIP